MPGPRSRSRRPAPRVALGALAVGALWGVLGTWVPGLPFVGTARASDTAGAWSKLQDWPLVAIHAVLSPTGTLLTFGAEGGARFAGGAGPKRHDTYDPRAGLHATVSQDAHDYFCSATVVVPDTGEIMVAGGDDFLSGDRGNPLTSFYDPGTGNVTAGARMDAPRWYGTTTTLPNGEILIQGGRYETNDDPALTPEIFDGSRWRRLGGVTSEQAYGTFGDDLRWWYPRAFVDPSGKVFTISQWTMFTLDPAGDGGIRFHGELPEDYRGGATSSAVMYAPGRILQVGGGGTTSTGGGNGLRSAAIIDITSGTPVVTPVAPMSYSRHWANATVLPNGQVLVNGGSRVNNQSKDVAYPAEIWDPETETWTVVAAESRPRLYHASAVLLADGRVYSGGGGAPGPNNELNAQFFTPPYLFDSGGALRVRPSIDFAPEAIAYGGRFDVRTGRDADIARVTLVKTGATTHSFNMDQRFVELDHEVQGNLIRVTAPSGPTVATPGYYLLSAIDGDGAVSESRIVTLLNATMPGSVERAPGGDGADTTGGGTTGGGTTAGDSTGGGTTGGDSTGGDSTGGDSTGGGTTGGGTVREDAEDGDTRGWSVYDDEPAGAAIANVVDAAAGSRVIALTGAGLDNGFLLGGTGVGDGEAWNDASNTVLSWRMNVGDGFRAYIAIDTANGFRYVQYDPGTRSRLDGIYAKVGIGQIGTGWAAYERDLATDLAAAEPGNTVRAVHGLLLRGELRIDDVVLDFAGTGGGGGGTDASCDVSLAANRARLDPNRWAMLALPCVPPAGSDTVGAVLGDDVGGVYGDDWVVFVYDGVSGDYVDPGANGRLAPGTGFWIFTAGPAATLDLPAGSVPAPDALGPGGPCRSSGGCAVTPLAATGSANPTWSMIGNPWPAPTVAAFDELRFVTSGGACAGAGCTFSRATDAGLAAGPGLFRYADGVYLPLITDDVTLSAWEGYWAATSSPATGLAPRVVWPR